jgi:hypothetical protein
LKSKYFPSGASSDPKCCSVSVKTTDNNFEIDGRLYTYPKNLKPFKTLKSKRKKNAYTIPNYQTFEYNQKTNTMKEF